MYRRETKPEIRLVHRDKGLPLGNQLAVIETGGAGRGSLRRCTLRLLQPHEESDQGGSREMGRDHETLGIRGHHSGGGHEEARPEAEHLLPKGEEKQGGLRHG